MSRKEEIRDTLIGVAQARSGGFEDYFYPLQKFPLWDDIFPYVAPFKDMEKLPFNSVVFRVLAVILERSSPEEISPNYIASFMPAFWQMIELNLKDRDNVCQDFAALYVVLEKSTLRPKETVGKFCTLLPRKPVGYGGHSVGFEIEFFSDKDETGKGSEHREVRPGPFTDADLCLVDGKRSLIEKTLDAAHEISCNEHDHGEIPYMHTLHVNWGLTGAQKKNLESINAYDSILRKVAYLANSGARNIELTLKDYKYYAEGPVNTEAPKNLIVTSEKNKFHDCSGTGEQIARAEYKGFCLAKDSDRALISRLVPAFWQALDDPERAKKLDADLNAIFAAAKIGESTLPSIDTLMKGKDEPDVKRWEQDFGLIDPEDGILKGRQISYRDLVKTYLEAFVQHKEAEVLPEIVAEAKRRQSDFEEAEKLGNPALGKTFREIVASRPETARTL